MKTAAESGVYYELSESIRDVGYFILSSGLHDAVLDDLRRALIEAIRRETEWHGSSDYTDYGMVLACPVYDTAFAEFLAADPIWQATSAVLGEQAIVYGYTASSLPPGGSNYSHRIHRDCPRSLSSQPTNLGLTFALDDFTADNGATWYVPGSHREAEPPTSEEFTRRAQQLVVPRGSAFFFDARLWHSGGWNTTHDWRHALTVNFCLGWMKQRLDLPRLLGAGYRAMISERAAQRLGFDSQVPASYFEYYQPAHRRGFRQPVT